MSSAALGILGAGRMGHAIASSLVHRRVFRPADLMLADPSAESRGRARRLGCRVTADAADAAQSRAILLAVKPQKIAEVAPLIRHAVRGKLVISILAGTTRRRLTSLLPGSRIIRVMPNTPLLAGEGATVIAGDGVSPKDLKWVKRIFEPMGRTWVVPEKWMNAVTALSGSGPALLCAFLEACVAAAIKNGLPQTLAGELALQTFSGTARLLRHKSGISPQELRKMVTSPGGTTEAALNVFGRRNLNGVVREAFRAAVRRGSQLSR